MISIGQDNYPIKNNVYIQETLLNISRYQATGFGAIQDGGERNMKEEK